MGANETKAKCIRVLLTRSVIDCHQRGLRTVAKALMDAGMEVVYSLYTYPEEVAAVAVEEGVDVIGISFLSFGQLTDTPKIMELLKEKGMTDVLVIVGGIIRDGDIPKLLEMGVARVFQQGASMTQIVDYINEQTA